MGDTVFRTSSLQLAAWILAAQILKYLRTENNSLVRQQKVFVFADPESKGLALEQEFYNGDPRVSVKCYNAAIKVLKEQFVQATGGDRHVSR